MYRCTWEAVQLTGSLVQGNLEGSPGFCFVAADGEDQLNANPRMQKWTRCTKHCRHVDDWIQQVPLEALPDVLQAIADAHADLGLPLQLEKCSFHVPALKGTPVEQLPASMRAPPPS